MMAKYLATSLAIEKVVSAPLVISSCLPTSTISISLVGLGSRSIMFPACTAARGRGVVEVDHVPGLTGGLGAGVHGDTDVALGQGGGVVGPVAGHGHHPPVGLLLFDQLA